MTSVGTTWHEAVTLALERGIVAIFVLFFRLIVTVSCSFRQLTVIDLTTVAATRRGSNLSLATEGIVDCRGRSAKRTEV